MPLPPELRVSISKAGDQFVAALERADNKQEIVKHCFTHEPDKLVHIEPQWVLEKGARQPADALRHDAGAGARPPADQLLVQYGQRLYSYLFGDGQKFKAFLEFNDAFRRQARLTLCLHPDAAALWSLPWEYLHDGAEFLCLSGQLLLSRAPLALGEVTPPEAALPLRILVVIAGPEGEAELDFERELAVMQDALDDARREGLVAVDYLDDATFPALQDALSRQTYHVLHYTGHGAFSHKENKGVLCFEDAQGRTDLIGAEELRPLLAGARDLRLVVLSACQSAKTSGLSAFDSVATGLLHAETPAVLAMQFSVLDESAIELARVFYKELARGGAPVEALHAARQAMRHLDERRPAEHRRFDWGVPALYLRAPAMRLIDPSSLTVRVPAGGPRADAGVEQGDAARYVRDFGGLPLPRIFVGRRPELRQLRRALRDRLPALYLRGIGGVGKSTVAAKLLDRPGAPLDGVCVIRCHELKQPLDALDKLANFWRAQGKTNHAEAAALLLDSRHDPADRARQAAQLLADRRYVVVFDNLESWFEKEVISDPTLRAILHGLLTARANSTYLFTGRYRWAELEQLPAQNRLELQLNTLTLRQALLLINTLPRLKDEPLDDKLDALARVGGHPKTLELLDGWLADGRRLSALLDDPTLGKKLADEWERYFLDDLLARLTPDERDSLTTLAILEEPFWSQMAYELLPSPFGRGDGGEGEIHSLLHKFLDLSLIQFHSPGTKAPWYTLHPVVREYLLGGLSETQRRALHLRAAAYYGQPFVDKARQAVAQSGQTRTEAQIESLARGRDGVVGTWVRQTQDMEHAHWAMDRALAWQSHLFQAGNADAAHDIVTAVWLALARWGKRDLAKALLRRSIDSREDAFARAVAQGNLANLLQDEGRLAGALAIHEQLYETFAAQGAKQQMATALSQMGMVYEDMGEYDRAIEKQAASLQIEREIKDEEGEAINLHQLSLLYEIKENYETAMQHSQEAETLNRKSNREHLVASNLHEQGIILTCLNRPAEAFERFRASFEILRRIGDESGAASSLSELGKLLRDNGQLREAIAAFNEVLEIRQRHGDPKIANVLTYLGEIHEQQGEYTAALEKYEQARLISQQAMPTNLPIIEQHIARVRGKRGGGFKRIGSG